MDEAQLSLDLKVKCEKERRVKKLEEKEQKKGSNKARKRHYRVYIKYQARKCCES